MKLISQKQISYILAIIILGLSAYYFIYNWKSVSAVHWWENPGILSIHIFLLLLTFILFVIGWYSILITTGSYVGIKVAGFTWLTSNVGKYIPGKVFMVAGRIALLSQFGLRKSVAAGNIIWEHVILVLAAIPFSLFILFNDAGDFSYKIFAATICVLILMLSIALNPIIIQRLINLLLRIFKQPSLEMVLERKAIFKLLSLYLLIWIVYGLSGVTLAYAFGFEGRVPMLLLFNVYIFSWFIGFISMITPGGIGIREGVLILMISPYIPVAELIVFALLARMTWIITELFGVIIGFILGNRLSPQKL